MATATLLRALAARADLVLHDWTDAEAEAVGLGADSLREEHPELCVVSVTPWGASGPYAARPATEFTLQAATGSVAYRGLRDRRPVAAGGQTRRVAGGHLRRDGGALGLARGARRRRPASTWTCLSSRRS